MDDAFVKLFSFTCHAGLGPQMTEVYHTSVVGAGAVLTLLTNAIGRRRCSFVSTREDVLIRTSREVSEIVVCS